MPKFAEIVISYLYCIQGIFLVLPSSIVLTYSEMPDYSTLSLFSLASLPFSFKFLYAPIVEKYFVPSYGRRKLWIVSSLLLSSVAIFLLSRLLGEKQAHIAAPLLLLIILCISVEDIATDGLAIN